MIYDPWHTLIFEALESVTVSLSFTAAVTYAAKLSTTSTDSSIQGLLGGVYYGVGALKSPESPGARDNEVSEPDRSVSFVIPGCLQAKAPAV